MLQKLQKLRSEELKRGLTLIGPHRDDLFFTLEGQNLGFYGSRGQQRSATLALKLGEATLMQQRTGEKPVLLLDDLLSELDSLRREHILQLLQQQKQQIFLTTTDLSVFTGAFLQDIQRKRVEMGEIYPG
jgi:DNA replication and repair protein RecF